MKKAIVFFAALLIVGMTAYAQSNALVKLSAELDTGAQDVISFSGANMSDAVSLSYAPIGIPSRFRIGLGVGSVDGNWGITTRLDSESLQAGGLAASWNRALVWGKVFDNLLTFKAGLLDEEAFSFTWRPWGAENIWGAQFDGSLGAEVQVNPVSNLTIGYIFPIQNGITFTDSLKGSNIAASYEMPGVFTIVGGVQLSRTVNSSDAWLGVDIKAIEGLTARVAAQAMNVGDANIALLEVYQEAGYVVWGIGLNLKAWEEFYAAANSGIGWQVEPTVSYPMGIVTLALSGDLGNLVAQDPNPSVPALQPFGFAVGPSATFVLAPSSTIRAGARFKVGDVNTSSATVQTFVSFRWVF
jgi:hypothetical protein